MTDKQRIAQWKRIKDPKKALQVLVENWQFVGNDPYYRDLCNALFELAERCSE